MGKAELKKKEEMYANKKMNDCIYHLNIKVQEAMDKDICHSKVSSVDCALWMVIACLFDNGTDDDNMDNEDEDAVDIDINKTGNWRRKTKHHVRDQVLKKKDIYEMKFPVRPLTTRRSRSARPNTPTTPHDCQKRLDFNGDEGGYQDTHELLQEQKYNRKLKEDNDSLKGKIYEIENEYSSVGGTSDTKKENINLRSELTEAMQNINRITQTHSDILDSNETRKIATERTIASLQQDKNCLEQELIDLRVKLDQIQSELMFFKTKQVHQQDFSNDKIDDLLQLNRKSEEDKQLLRDKVYSLENDKIKLEDMYKKQASDRITSDNISTKYKEENERLRKERNSLRIEFQRVLRENKESKLLNTEHGFLREELQNKEREKSDLFTIFKEKANKDLQKIKRYENEIENLESRLKNDIEKIQRFESEIETLKSRLTEEKAYQYNAYEMLQIKNDFDVLKHQKKVLEDDFYKIQKENTALENEIQNLNSKLQQFDDSASNMPSLNKRIQDLEERSENMCIGLREKDQELNHLKSVLNNAKFKGLQLVADLDCGESMIDIEEENENLQRDLSRLNKEIYKTNRRIESNAQLMSARNQKESSMSTGEGKISTGTVHVNQYNFSANNESGSENVSACSGNQMIMSSSSNFNSTRHIISEQHRTININANTVQISDNASITMSSNKSVDENRHHFELEEQENQQHLGIEN